MPLRQSLPLEHLRGTCAPFSVGPSASWTGIPAKEAVASFGFHFSNAPSAFSYCLQLLG